MNCINYEIENQSRDGLQKIKAKLEIQSDIKLSNEKIETLGTIFSEIISNILNEPDKEFKILV